MKMNANRANTTLKDSPGIIMPKALLEFKTSHVKKLLAQYMLLEPRAKQLGIVDIEKVTRIMDEVIGMVIQIQDKKILSLEAVNLAFECVEKIRTVSNIVEKVKEIKAK